MLLRQGPPRRRRNEIAGPVLRPHHVPGAVPLNHPALYVRELLTGTDERRIGHLELVHHLYVGLFQADLRDTAATGCDSDNAIPSQARAGRENEVRHLAVIPSARVHAGVGDERPALTLSRLIVRDAVVDQRDLVVAGGGEIDAVHVDPALTEARAIPAPIARVARRSGVNRHGQLPRLQVVVPSEVHLAGGQLRNEHTVHVDPHRHPLASERGRDRHSPRRAVNRGVDPQSVRVGNVVLYVHSQEERIGSERRDGEEEIRARHSAGLPRAWRNRLRRSPCRTAPTTRVPRR